MQLVESIVNIQKSISPKLQGVGRRSIHCWKSLTIIFLTIDSILPFELGNWSKNSFKNRLSKWGILLLWLGHLDKIFHIFSFLWNYREFHIPLENYYNMLFYYLISSFIWKTFDINNNHFQQYPPLVLTTIA